MEMLLQIAGVCLLGAVLGSLLRQKRPELALLLALAVCDAVVLAAGRGLMQVLDFMQELLQLGGLPGELFTPLLKTLGIALVCRIGSALCRDAGEAALAQLLETAGAFGAVLVSLPLFRAVWELLRSLL